MVDIMVDVLDRPELHLKAADGYKKTAVAVEIGGLEDALICREAAEYWNDLGMREIVNKEVAMIRSEVRAGRLRWTMEDVYGLMPAYPKNKQVDAILEKLHDDNWSEDQENIWKDENEQCDDPDPDDTSHNAAELPEERSDDELRSSESQQADAVSRSSGALVLGCGHEVLTAGQAEVVQHISEKVDTLNNIEEELARLGLMDAAAGIHHEAQKQKRRTRALCSEHPAVAGALSQRSAQQNAERKRKECEKIAAQVEQSKLQARVKRLKLQNEEETAKLNKIIQDVIDFESLAECTHALKTFTPEFLGEGQKNNGGAKCRDRRHEVLDRLARLGSGLTPQQKNDFTWFKDSWDTKCAAESPRTWGGKFAGLCQKILNDMGTPTHKHAFSVFVSNETQRHFANQGALTL